MSKRVSILKNESPTINGDLYTGNNFSVNKYFTDSLSNINFNFNSKGERLKDVENIIDRNKNNYSKTSEQFVDVLLNNYQTFMNIGKYVDRIDKNITNVMNTQKNYSILLQNLRKDVEEFTIDYVKYLKEVENEKNKNIESSLNKEKTNKLYFEEYDILEKALENDFKLDEFLNPKKGTRRWLEEQPERMRVLIDEKKFLDCVKLVEEIRECELELVDYETKLELDNVYNYLIEKLTVSISRSSSSKDVQYYLDKMKTLGCVGLAIDTFLNWLSKKLKAKVNKILNQDDKEMDIKYNLKESELNLMKSNKNIITRRNRQETIIEDEGEEVDLDDDTEMTIQADVAGGTSNDNGLVRQETVNKNLSEKKSGQSQNDKKIIKIITEYFNTLEKFIKIMEEYFKMNENYAYSSYIIPWLKQEIQLMAKTIENLFAKISNFSELKSVMRYMTTFFLNFDKKGSSGKYIFDLYFINNIKISMEAIINFCMRSEKDGLSFDLKEYEIKHLDNIIKINCVSELGNAVSNVSQIISDFIIEFINNKQKFIGIIFIEEYFFDNILTKEFLTFLRNKVVKSMANNYEVKSFSDGQESMASTNQILINYGISILSIENLFDFFLNEMNKNKLVSISSLESIKNIKSQISETKSEYFSKLFKIKIESHFFKFFELNKITLAKDISEDFREPDRVFIVFFHVIKNLAKSIKLRINDPKYLYFFIVENQYVNFLKIIDSVRQLDKIYDTEFNFYKIGILGLENVIYGILFIYNSIQKILGIDEEGKFRIISDNFIDELIKEFSITRNINIERFEKNRSIYQDKVMKYIAENRIELLKGY